MIQQVSEFIAEYGTPVVTAVFGEGSFLGELSISNPLMVPIILIIVPAIIFFGVSFYIDFIKDAWKMPFGILLDLIAFFLFIFAPGLLFVMAFVAAGLYFILSIRQKFWKFLYVLVGFGKLFLISPMFQGSETLKIIIVFLPIYTIAMFFLCITD